MSAAVIRSMTAAATGSVRRSAIARAAGPATTRPYGASLPLTKGARRFDAAHHVTGKDGALRFKQLTDHLCVGENSEGLLERLEVVRADQHGGGRAVAGDRDPVVLPVHPVDELREPIFHGPE